MGIISTTGPFERAFSEGFAYRQAVEGPPRLIILVGMWMLFLPTLLLPPLVGFLAGDVSVMIRIIAACCAALSAAIPFRVTRNFITRKRSTSHNL